MTLEALDMANNLLQIVVVAGATAAAARCAAERRAVVFALLAGALGCFLLGDVFYTLHLRLANDAPIIFSAADLSYLGFYAFLIAVCLERIHGWDAARRQRARAYRRVAFVAPILTILFHIAYIAIYPDILFNNLIYCALMSVLTYYVFWLFLASGGGDARSHRPMRAYHGIVLSYLFIELVMYLFSSLGLPAPAIALDFVLTFFYPPVVRALKKGVDA
jgi:hypothetical protein